MEPKKAIENLKFIRETENDAELMAACTMGMNALEKMVPQRVETTKSFRGITEYICPTCGKAYREIDRGDVFCRRCGQALDWRERNDTCRKTSDKCRA